MPNATRNPGRSLHGKTRSAAELRRQLDGRDSWLQEIAPTSLFHTLFDSLPGLHFFAKNQRGEIMFLSRSIRERYGLRDDASTVGLTDFDINPHGMAESYVSDDARIYSTGEPMSDRVELWWDAQGVPNWYVVTKLPIWSRRGRIIGVMGVIQEYEGHARFDTPWREIAASVKFIRQHFRKQVSIAALARQAGLSIRQLQRRFRAVLRLTPQEFLIKTRVLAACRALRESDASLSDIASACGFYDQSSFTEHFRRHAGQTPLAYRRQILRCAT
ncbi:PAS domain-containing protein [Roseimicrobium gellanilyticum]|uniref:PAS domain-containing protein n=1 Tax=Roseimicrobium gellanilyticum TaxID=748857 RepID=A0A366HLM2_9BACT|nr:helix-turn-helix domain-containing protein [Roseimicrobium gellanilyticum]RBP43823.1 PAS domain-containing protein [Roseimicrobium gellanilyticum]